MPASEPYRIYLIGGPDLNPDAVETLERLNNAIADDVSLGVTFPAPFVYVGSAPHSDFPDVCIHEWATEVLLPAAALGSDAAA